VTGSWRCRLGNRKAWGVTMNFAHRKPTKTRIDALLYWVLLFASVTFLATYAMSM
jgi:hypothetical protein